MILFDITYDSPQENILFDEALLLLAERNEIGESLRFWESPTPFIVLGRISKEQDDLIIDKVKEDAIAVLRRASGGGTVVQGKGCLNYSVVLNKENNPQLNDLKQSYAYILEKVVHALASLGVKAQYLPISDIALCDSNKKFSGNAQKRARQFILHHGTILYDFDLSLISQYLAMPKDMPEYRQQRTHDNFVTNISCSLNSLKESIASSFNAQAQDCIKINQGKIIKELIEKRNIFVTI